MPPTLETHIEDEDVDQKEDDDVEEGKRGGNDSGSYWVLAL